MNSDMPLHMRFWLYHDQVIGGWECFWGCITCEGDLNWSWKDRALFAWRPDSSCCRWICMCQIGTIEFFWLVIVSSFTALQNIHPSLFRQLINIYYFICHGVLYVLSTNTSSFFHAGILAAGEFSSKNICTRHTWVRICWLSSIYGLHVAFRSMQLSKYVC